MYLRADWPFRQDGPKLHALVQRAGTLEDVEVSQSFVGYNFLSYPQASPSFKIEMPPPRR
jgi:hypothetical protein